MMGWLSFKIIINLPLLFYIHRTMWQIRSIRDYIILYVNVLWKKALRHRVPSPPIPNTHPKAIGREERPQLTPSQCLTRPQGHRRTAQTLPPDSSHQLEGGVQTQRDDVARNTKTDIQRCQIYREVRTQQEDPYYPTKTQTEYLLPR